MNVDFKAELIVIGGGGAGLAAAVTAAEQGLNTILLEAGHKPGGNAVFPGGIFAVDSPLQQQLGLNLRKQDVFKEFMDYSRWKTNPKLVRSLIDKSGETIRWLEEKGVKFTQVRAHADGYPSVYHMSSNQGKTGFEVVQALVKHCNELGVRIFCDTRATKLLISNDGKITGVLAKTRNGENRIAAKSVIIATGGFAGNLRLLKKYFPDLDMNAIHRTGLPHKGDGLRMATEVGAASEGMMVLEMSGPRFRWSSAIRTMIKLPSTIWINKNGERFIDENTSSLFDAANSIFRQPGQVSYTIFDENIKQTIVKELGDSSISLDSVNKDLKICADKGVVKNSGSWDEIAEWIGAVPAALKKQIDEYNYFCDKGYDELFLKDKKYLQPLRKPPYHALLCCNNLLTTHGGIKINQHTEVLDKCDKPISGLYAAGVETGGTDSDTYNISLMGHSFGFALTTGRIAGERAACFIQKKSAEEDDSPL